MDFAPREELKYILWGSGRRLGIMVGGEISYNELLFAMLKSCVATRGQGLTRNQRKVTKYYVAGRKQVLSIVHMQFSSQ